MIPAVRFCACAKTFQISVLKSRLRLCYNSLIWWLRSKLKSPAGWNGCLPQSPGSLFHGRTHCWTVVDIDRLHWFLKLLSALFNLLPWWISGCKKSFLQRLEFNESNFRFCCSQDLLVSSASRQCFFFCGLGALLCCRACRPIIKQNHIRFYCVILIVKLVLTVVRRSHRTKMLCFSAG